MSDRVLVLLSGGLDSSVLLMKMRDQAEIGAVFFDRGQSNAKSERAAARYVAERAQCQLQEVDLTAWWRATGKRVRMIDVPRNGIFALLAVPFAKINNCSRIAIGSTIDDATTADSNRKFVVAINNLMEVMDCRQRVVAPFIDLKWGKRELAEWALNHLGEDFVKVTHSCWKETSCGVCPACVARKQALDGAKPLPAA